MDYVPLSHAERIINPIHYLLARNEEYGTSLIMLNPQNNNHVVISMNEFCEIYQPVPDISRFIALAEMIPGFNIPLFLKNILSMGKIDRKAIPSMYMKQINSYEPYYIETERLRSDIPDISLLRAGKDDILSFRHISAIYVSMMFILPKQLDEDLFDEMEITENVISITYIKGDKQMYKQTANVSKEDIDIITSRKIPTQQRIEDGLIITLSLLTVTVNIKVTRWHIEISSSEVIKINEIIDKLRADWGIVIKYIFISEAKYTMAIKDIPYEKIMYYWGLSKSAKYRENIEPKEVNSKFWNLLDPTTASMRYLVYPPFDFYSHMFKGANIKPYLYTGNSYIPEYDHQPHHMDRILEIMMIGANAEHAKYVMFYLATSVKEVMSYFPVLRKELNRLLPVNGVEIYDEYLISYTRRLSGDDRKGRKRIFKLSNHNTRMLSPKTDSSLLSGYNSQCNAKYKPVISVPEDEEIWKSAGYKTGISDGSLYICQRGKPITAMTIKIGDVSHTFYCCKARSDNDDLEILSTVHEPPAEFIKGGDYPDMVSISDPIIFSLFKSYKGVLTVNKKFVAIPDQFLLIHCIAHALDIEDPWTVINESYLVASGMVSLDLSGKVYIDHVSTHEILEEIFGITLVVFELSDIARRNKTSDRTIVFVTCVRNGRGYPFYYLVSVGIGRRILSRFDIDDDGYSHFSRIVSDLSIINKATNGTIEPIRAAYGDYLRTGMLYPLIIIDSIGFVVVKQTVDLENRRVISLVIVANEGGEFIIGAIYHAPSVLLNIPVVDDISPYMIPSSYWLNVGVIPAQVSENTIVHESHAGKYIFVCEVSDDLLNRYEVIEDPSFITITKGDPEIDLRILNLKEQESMNRLLLNILAQMILLFKDRFYDFIRFEEDVKILSWTREPYRLVEHADEIFPLIKDCITYTVRGIIHDPIQTNTFIIDSSLIQGIDYFVRYIQSRKDYSNNTMVISLSPNADKFFYETDYKQNDKVLTFIDMANLWKYTDSQNTGTRVTMYISPHLATRETPYKLRIGSKVFLVYNVSSEQEAEFVIDYYNQTREIPDRVSLITAGRIKLHEKEYIKYRISNSRNTKVSTMTEKAEGKIYKILYYPIHYTGYPYAALLLDEEE